jgi:hypothetical protein
VPAGEAAETGSGYYQRWLKRSGEVIEDDTRRTRR